MVQFRHQTVRQVAALALACVSTAAAAAIAVWLVTGLSDMNEFEAFWGLPGLAITSLGGVVCGHMALRGGRSPSGWSPRSRGSLRALVRVVLVIAYVCVAVAALLFLFVTVGFGP